MIRQATRCSDGPGRLDAGMVANRSVFGFGKSDCGRRNKRHEQKKRKKEKKEREREKEMERRNKAKKKTRH